jgi:hypothetical protein
MSRLRTELRRELRVAVALTSPVCAGDLTHRQLVGYVVRNGLPSEAARNALHEEYATTGNPHTLIDLSNDDANALLLP